MKAVSKAMSWGNLILINRKRSPLRSGVGDMSVETTKGLGAGYVKPQNFIFLAATTPPLHNKNK